MSVTMKPGEIIVPESLRITGDGTNARIVVATNRGRIFLRDGFISADWKDITPGS
jgi:hypothetical protein